jgi:hypothetical protein
MHLRYCDSKQMKQTHDSGAVLVSPNMFLRVFYGRNETGHQLSILYLDEDQFTW